MNKYFITGVIFLAITSICSSQQVIKLQNPSFEDIPRKGADHSLPIKGWEDCGIYSFPEESPPDIHPVPSSAWEVKMGPKDGATYLGLVVRQRGSYEGMSQNLFPSLKEATCYSLSVFLAASRDYKSATIKNSSILENFTRPVEFLIWGGTSICDHEHLLARSLPVDYIEWKSFTIEFYSPQKFNYITIEANYQNGSVEHYNGHVLVDGFSPITEIECK